MREETHVFKRRLYTRGENVFPTSLSFLFSSPSSKVCAETSNAPFLLPSSSSTWCTSQLCRQLGESSAFLLSTCLPGCVYGGGEVYHAGGFREAGVRVSRVIFFLSPLVALGARQAMVQLPSAALKRCCFCFHRQRRDANNGGDIFFCLATFDASMTPAVWPSEELLVFEA